MRRLDLVVGPNGAGKSTFVALTLGPLLPGSVFVNADEIARQQWPDDTASHAYDAARIAASTRSRLIGLGRSFIAETVFSHPSKLELIRDAQAAGYTVALHVVIIPEALAVERVKRRVLHGGHDVPEDKIRARHRRLWSLVNTAIELADSATVYDNAQRRGPRIVAQFHGGALVGAGILAGLDTGGLAGPASTLSGDFTTRKDPVLVGNSAGRKVDITMGHFSGRQRLYSARHAQTPRSRR